MADSSTTIGSQATMSSDGTLVTKAASGVSSTSEKTSNSTLDKDAFLQLLVAQMKYQDPLEPTSNTEYVAQLATFSQVEELQNMQNSMAQTQANNLMGKIVVMKTTTASGATAYVSGEVERVVANSGKTYLGVDGSLYDIDDLDSIVSEDFYDKYYKDKTTSTEGTETGTTGSTTGSTDSSDKADLSEKTDDTEKA